MRIRLTPTTASIAVVAALAVCLVILRGFGATAGGAVLSIIALLFAVWQTSEAVRQTRALDNVQSSLSTRYLGVFPDFMPRITKLLESAKHEIIIVCDFPSYGFFSDHLAWLDYEAAIKRLLSRGTPVRISFLNRDRRRELLAEQFGYSAKIPDSWKSDERLRQKLEAFITRSGITDISADSISFEQYERGVEQMHRTVFEASFRGIVSREIHNVLPIYFWIVDGREAVFSIPTFSEFFKEQGFVTSDTRLIAAFVNMERRLT